MKNLIGREHSINAFDEKTAHWASTFGDYWRGTDRVGETHSSSGHYLRRQAFLGTSSHGCKKELC